MSKTGQRSGSCSPVSGAFKPVEDVGAPCVVDLVKRMGVGLLNGHCIAERGRKIKECILLDGLNYF